MSDPEDISGENNLADYFEAAALAALAAARIAVSGTVYPWAGYLQNACLAALLVLILVRPKGRPRLPDRLGLIGLFVYFTAALASVPFSIMPANSLRWFLLHLGDLLLFLCIAGAGKKRLHVIAAAMLAAGAVSAAFAVRQRLGGFALTLESGMVSDYARNVLGEARAFGLTFSPDMLAGTMAGLLPVGLGFLLASLQSNDSEEGGQLLKTALSGMALVLFAIVLVLTRSVGGWLAAFAGVFAWLILHWDTLATGAWAGRRKTILAGAILLMLAGAAGIIAMRGGHVFDFDDPHNPAAKRLDNWVTGVKVYREFPVIGAGGGQHGLAALLHRSPTGNEARHAHNVMVEVLAETGPAGLMGLLLIFAAFFRSGFRLLRQPLTDSGQKAENELKKGFMAGGAAIVAHSMIDFDWQVMEVAALFWAAWACVAVDGDDSAEGKLTGLRKWALALVVLMIIFCELFQMQGERLKAKAVQKSREGDQKKAQSYARQAIAWDGSRDDMYGLLAGTAIHSSKEDKYSSAEKYLRRAISLNPRYPFYYRDLGFLLGRKDPEAGIASLRKSVALYPNSMDLNLALGGKLRQLKRFDEAREVLEQATKCHYSKGDALFELGLLYMEQGKDGLAEKYLRDSVNTLPAREYHAVALSRFLAGQDRTNEAIRVLENWLKKYPQDKAAIRELSTLGKAPE